MNRSDVSVNSLPVSILEDGTGSPVLYLHGFADVHAATDSLLPFHAELARGVRLIAPAHPGCGTSAETRESFCFMPPLSLPARRSLKRSMSNICRYRWPRVSISARGTRRKSPI